MSSSQDLVPGCADAAGTRAYIAQCGPHLPAGHYSDFRETGIALSSLGVGTFPGAASDSIDRRIADIVARALQTGINVIDTATHYRYGRSPRAVGAGVRAALAAGVPRAGMFLISKGGFLLFADGPPPGFRRWFNREIIAKGLGTSDDVAAKAHLISPEYINHQIDLSRDALGVATLDAFLIDQPEIHIPEIGKQALIRKLANIFVVLEQAVRAGKLKYYGVSSFHAFRVHTDDKYYLSLVSLLALAEQAARDVAGVGAPHHFAIVQFPFNGVMLEAFSRFNQITGQGNEASTIQAALQFKLFTMASHSLFKGHLAKQSIDVIARALPALANPAQRAIQFNRSTPGLGTALVGMSTPAHLDDLLAVACAPLLSRQGYLGMYEKAESKAES